MKSLLTRFFAVRIQATLINLFCENIWLGHNKLKTFSPSITFVGEPVVVRMSVVMLHAVMVHVVMLSVLSPFFRYKNRCSMIS